MWGWERPKKNLIGGEAMDRLIQRIYFEGFQEPLEIEVGLAPLAWTRAYPTHVRVEGEIDPQTLQELVDYVERLGGWKWDDEVKRFYPV